MIALQEFWPRDPAFARLINRLEAANLLTSDLLEGDARYFMLAGTNGAPVAFAGLAGTGSDLLLRSVVVESDQRRSGLGAAMVALIEAEAKASGAQAVWLLTEDAMPFFARQGWHAAARETAPRSVSASAQFRGLCPASATLMCKRLTP